MKTDAFLTCLGYYGVATGTSDTIEGVYSFNSGTTGIVFNRIYSSGAHFINGQIYSATIPLINVYTTNVNNEMFSGKNGWKVGYRHTGNFGLILDLEYSGCSRPVNQRGMVIVSTAASPASLDSGFYIGITENSRLYFQTSGQSSTLNKELSVRDFVYVGLSENKYVTFGIFSLDDNKLYKNVVALSTGRLNSHDIYIGNFLTYNSSDYTGFSGKINQAILFNNTLTDNDVGVCSNCSLVTGYNLTTNAYSFLAQQLTGSYFSGVMEHAVTGYTNVAQAVYTYNGTPISILEPSGMTGYFQTGQVVVPLFSGVTIQNERDEYVFLYDTPALNAFSTFSLYFNLMLSSGDSIEVYTYPRPNTNIGKLLDGLNWPTGSNIQLIANGLNETLNTDYAIVRNQVSGFDSYDVLSYDVLVNSSIVTAYSGYWNGTSRILMSGGGFFPSDAQYFEDTTNFTGIIKITGLSGVCVSNPFYPSFGYDLHMNGQKLISGLHYEVVGSGDNGFVVSLSGNNLPALIIYPDYDVTGGGPISVSEVEDSELAFIPEFSGFIQTRIDVTGDDFSFGNFTGFGEQVWVNGIRQLASLDYQKVYPCSMITGQFNAPNLDFIAYDSEAGNDTLWNINVPPLLHIVNDGTPGWMRITVVARDINGHSTSGNCIEIWSSQLDNSQNFSPFKYTGYYPTGQSTINYTGYRNPSSQGSGVVLGRYHINNIIGNWYMTAPAIVFDNPYDEEPAPLP